MKEANKLNNIIKSIIENNNIELIKIRTDNSGKAYVNKNQIEIPKIKNVANFITALHEIGHIVKNASSQNLPKHQSEYLAITYSYLQCEIYKIKIPKTIKYQDRNYLIKCICEDFETNRIININEIETKIFQFCNINKTNWQQNLIKGFLPKFDHITQSINWKET